MKNRGSKVFVNPFSAKLLPAFENEQAKITVSTQLASVFQFSFLRLFSTTKHQLNFKLRVVCLLTKPLCSLSHGDITLLESDHDIVGYQVSGLIS